MKHLNPRQGITTAYDAYDFAYGASYGVKHLNPRQGITTRNAATALCCVQPDACETPKSPPGDYNAFVLDIKQHLCAPRCETPKSPPGDYNPKRTS